MYVTVTKYDRNDRETSTYSEFYDVPAYAFDDYAEAVTEAESVKGFDSKNSVSLDTLTRTTVYYADGSATVVSIS